MTPLPRFALLALFMLVTACASGSGGQTSTRSGGFGIAGRNPDDCEVETKPIRPPRQTAAAALAPTKEEIRSFQDDNCGPDCARKRATRYQSDVARQQRERAAAEARYRAETKSRELECILGSGCVRRGVLAGIAR